MRRPLVKKRKRNTRRFLPGTNEDETFELHELEDWMTGQGK